jgi:tRNA(Ile)-lysidine synthase
LGTQQNFSVLPQEFFDSLDKLGPFEKAPKLAVAFSGGPDSMALLVLSKQWAERHGGKITALIVDHRLRDDSTIEAETVLGRAKHLGVEAFILARNGEPIISNIQAKAREARYCLLINWCARNGNLHLLLGHHRDDQAETLRMREERGSGDDGLAGMPPILEYTDVRLLRPLLHQKKSGLRATVAKFNVMAVEDPSNHNLRFDRVRTRYSFATEADREILSNRADRYGVARFHRDEATATHFARSTEIYPEGYAVLDPHAWRQGADDIGLRSLSALCAMIGGRGHPPHRKKVERLQEAILRDEVGGGRTMSGCRIVPRDGKILILRELELIERAARLDGELLWDGRYRVELTTDQGRLSIGKLGEDGVREVLNIQPDLAVSHLPKCVCPTLPAIWDLEGVYQVPHLKYSRDSKGADGLSTNIIKFTPIRPLQATRFTF